MDTSVLESRVITFIKDNNLINRNDTIMVATSGGIDSITLLTFLDKYKHDLGITVWALHVNHGIRGEAANRDMRFVQSFCQDRKIQCFTFDAYAEKVNVPENASEGWARNLRYNFFNKMSTTYKAKVAIAHSISDQAETFLFRVMRGVGLRGLAGIKPQRDQYIRPFMSLTRKEIEQLFNSYNIEHINDETNDTDAYARNKIRHNILPEMQEINQSTLNSINKICTHLGKVEAYICKQAKALADEAYMRDNEYITSKLRRADDVVREQFICDLLCKHTSITESVVTLINKRIMQAELKEHDKGYECERLVDTISITDKLTLYITNYYVTLVEEPESETITSEDIEAIQSAVVTEFEFGNLGNNVSIHKVSAEKFKRDTLDIRQLAHYASIHKLKELAPLTIRAWEPGDRFKPACKVERKVKAVVRELKIPLALRHSIPLITDNSGRIIWVWGMGFTDGMVDTLNSKDSYSYKFK